MLFALTECVARRSGSPTDLRVVGQLFEVPRSVRQLPG